jgi:hypothetical protein
MIENEIRKLPQVERLSDERIERWLQVDTKELYKVKYIELVRAEKERRIAEKTE